MGMEEFKSSNHLVIYWLVLFKFYVISDITSSHNTSVHEFWAKISAIFVRFMVLEGNTTVWLQPFTRTIFSKCG